MVLSVLGTPYRPSYFLSKHRQTLAWANTHCLRDLVDIADFSCLPHRTSIADTSAHTINSNGCDAALIENWQPGNSNAIYTYTSIIEGASGNLYPYRCRWIIAEKASMAASNDDLIYITWLHQGG
tara:strand:+ start:343 stop:717 length:375 start_codon:yes stop_codon:yes gene_type:complete